MSDITGLLLAAGSSNRFGSNKLLARVDAQPLVLRSASALSVCDKTLAVVRAEDRELQRVLQQAGIEWVVNPRADEGMGTSIAEGVTASPDSDAWCILPADMPAIQPSTAKAVLAALRAGAALTAPFYRDRRGHPVGFDKTFRQELVALNGDQGARSILQAHTTRLVRLTVDDPGVLQDIDTPEDLQRA